MKRCKTCRVATTTEKEEVASYECEESNFVRLELDCHVRSNPPTQYLEFTLEKILSIPTIWLQL
jgi:hypothetical protein